MEAVNSIKSLFFNKDSEI